MDDMDLAKARGMTRQRFHDNITVMQHSVQVGNRVYTFERGQTLFGYPILKRVVPAQYPLLHNPGLDDFAG